MRILVAVLTLYLASLQQSFAEPMKVGIENLNYYPYYSTSGGSNKGAAIDLLQKFSADSGHAITFKALPVARLLPTFLSKGVEYKFPANPNWAQSAKEGADLVYSDPIFQFKDGVLVKKENKSKGIKKLGIVRGFTAWDYLDQIKAGEIKVTEGTNLEAMVKMLDLGRIDGLYCNINVAKYIVNKVLGNNESIVFDDSLPHTTSNYHLASNGNSKTIDDLNSFLAKEKAYIEALKKEYGIY